jgi:hypothetical protein
MTSIKKLIDTIPAINVGHFNRDTLEIEERLQTPRGRYEAEWDAIFIDGENAYWADYYGEFNNYDPWIHPTLEAWAEKHNVIIDWFDPGTLMVSLH